MLFPLAGLLILTFSVAGLLILTFSVAGLLILTFVNSRGPRTLPPRCVEWSCRDASSVSDSC